MSDTAETTPTPPEAPPAPAAETSAPASTTAAPPKPPERGRERRPPNRGDGGKPFSRKPAYQGGPVPVLEDEARYGKGPKIHDLDAEIENELAEALGGVSTQDLFSAEAKQAEAKSHSGGERKKGKVFRIHGPDVFVDIPGGRSQGILSIQQFPEGPPEIGSEVEVNIEGYDNANGLLILNRRGAAMHADWDSVAIGQTVEARVVALNKGGLEVDVNGIRGFLPISQIDLYRVENAEPYLNQRLMCMVAEADARERNLVVSRRALLEREREENKEKLWAELSEGQTRTGIVRSVREFGAFVDLGGVDGLVHVSEMSWNRVQDPQTLVHPGETVRVVVLKLDREARKVGLGMKQLLASPWDDIEQKYPHSHIVKGRVSRVAEFGAFVELEPGLEGLIHISELAPQRVRRVVEVVQVGQEVSVMVLQIDKQQRRIALSLRAATAEAKEAEEAAVEEGEPEEVKPVRPLNYTLRGGLGSRE